MYTANISVHITNCNIRNTSATLTPDFCIDHLLTINLQYIHLYYIKVHRPKALFLSTLHLFYLCFQPWIYATDWWQSNHFKNGTSNQAADLVHQITWKVFLPTSKWLLAWTNKKQVIVIVGNAQTQKFFLSQWTMNNYSTSTSQLHSKHSQKSTCLRLVGLLILEVWSTSAVFLRSGRTSPTPVTRRGSFPEPVTAGDLQSWSARSRQCSSRVSWLINKDPLIMACYKPPKKNLGSIILGLLYTRNNSVGFLHCFIGKSDELFHGCCWLAILIVLFGS